MMIIELLLLINLMQKVENYKQYQDYIDKKSDYLLQIDRTEAEKEYIEYIEPEKMRITCYLPTGNRTASGCWPFIGSCAGRKEDIGKVAVIYDLDMNYLGVWEIRDCGGSKSLRNGSSLDLYMPDMKTAREWIKAHGDYCYVQIIEGKG